jgi:hypothetical protein
MKRRRWNIVAVEGNVITIKYESRWRDAIHALFNSTAGKLLYGLALGLGLGYLIFR